MKRTLVGLALILLIFQAVGTAKDAEQPEWANKLATINFEDAPMGGILGTLEKAAGFVLQMDKDLMPDLEHRLTIRIERTPMGEILSSLLSTQNLGYRVVDARTIEIVRK